VPAVTVDRLREKLHINMEQYSQLFIGYSVSNSIVPMLSGAFYTKMGASLVAGVGAVCEGGRNDARRCHQFALTPSFLEACSYLPLLSCYRRHCLQARGAA
jgi:hypothetical protein